jgi:1-acyl-sn-glycerol-3-phosphate acyltransferase
MAKSAVHNLLRPVCHPVIKALWLKETYGRENIPSGPVILASNHESYLDFLVLDAALPRPPTFLAGEVFYENRILGWTFDQMKFIKVDRRSNHGSMGVIRSSLRALDGGNLVVLYPEGTRSPNGVLQKAHDGVGYLAHMSEAPVVPVAVSGTHEAWPKGRARPGRGPCTVRFGAPMAFSRADYKRDRTVIAATTRTIMRSVAQLAGEEYGW